jgi:hypothetical protein
MADYVLESRVWLPRPRPEVFAFFSDVANLARLSPPSARFRWRQPPPAALVAGAVLDFSVRGLGLRSRWLVIVRELDPPYRFVDAQIRGPFARWEHRHRFLDGRERADGPAGTWVEDRVTYRLPAGPIGRVAHAVVVRPRLAAGFAYRARALREIFGARLTA